MLNPASFFYTLQAISILFNFKLLLTGKNLSANIETVTKMRFNNEPDPGSNEVWIYDQHEERHQDNAVRY